MLAEAVDVSVVDVEAKVQMPEGIRLRVRPVYLQEANGARNLIGCKIESVEQGEQQWMNLCYVPRW